MVNLPTPQSRIEELMNAFITRDLSRVVTPQSRIEEFWYNLIEGTNSLPIPQSRVELLLKKIIENDTKETPLARSRIEEFLIAILTGEIDNLPIPQSRSEEYLNYIATNNNVIDEDIEYLAYTGTNITAHNTVEKPIRSAILSGKTETMIDKFEQGTINSWDGTSFPKPESTTRIRFKNIIDLKQDIIISVNDKYEVSVQTSEPDAYGWSNSVSFRNNGVFILAVRKKDQSEIVPSDILGADFNINIPHFTDMKSVKLPVLTTTGKNLANSKMEMGNIRSSDGTLYDSNAHIRTKDYIPINPSINTVTLSNNKGYIGVVFEYDKDYKFIKYTTGKSDTTIATLNDDCRFIKFRTTDSSNATDLTALFQLEEGSIATSHEPYKSNILSIDGEYRGIGDVQDTLDCLTGEVVERIGEVVLDGSENWVISHYITGYTMFRYIVPNLPTSTSIRIGCMLCDKFNVENYINTQAQTREFITIRNGTTGQLLLNISNEKASDVAMLKEWLSQNPITVQYPLAESVIKTVDLKVVDQDGNPVNQLFAFDSTTHIISGSESDNSLIAIAEVEVPTKVIDGLSDAQRLSTEVDEFCIVVQTLQDNQDINSTLAMTAITELYELALEGGEL